MPNWLSRPESNQPTGRQRAGQAIGTLLLGPIGGWLGGRIGANWGRGQTPMNLPAHQSPNFGLGMTPQAAQPGANVSTASLGSDVDRWIAAQQQARINGAGQGQPVQGAAPSAPTGTASQLRNAPYLDMATAIANQRYQQDIGFRAPNSNPEMR